MGEFAHMTMYNLDLRTQTNSVVLEEERGEEGQRRGADEQCLYTGLAAARQVPMTTHLKSRCRSCWRWGKDGSGGRRRLRHGA